MRFLSYVTVVCALLVGAMLQPAWAQSPSFDHSQFYEEIPFRFVNGKVLIPVMIAGETYEFILDSGGLLFVSNRVAEQAKFDTLGTRDVSGITKQSKTFAKVRVPDVQIGALHFKNFVGLAGTFFEQYPVTCLEADGLIGRDFIKRFIVQYDYQQEQVIFTDQRDRLELKPESGMKMKLVDGGLPLLTLKTSRGKVKNVKFDCGSGDLLSLQTKQAAKWAGKAAYQDAMLPLYGTFSLGISLTRLSPRNEYMCYYPTVEVAGATIQDVYTAETKASGARVGAGLFPLGKVTTDYPAKTFYFEPYPNATLTGEEPMTGFGFYSMRVEGTWEVSGIIKGSPAEQAGLAPGQEILRINEVEMATLDEARNCKNYLEGAPWKEGDVVTVVVKDKSGDEKAVTLERYVWEGK